jgi:hypothetical protein
MNDEKSDQASRQTSESVMDRLDALLSARQDDELNFRQRAELERLLAEYPEHGARERAFEAIDAGLASLAAEPAGDEGLAIAYQGLRTRLDLGQPSQSQSQSPRWGRSVVPLLFAASAAILFYLVLPMRPPTSEEPAVATTTENRRDDREGTSGLDARLEDELVLVLGYGDEMSEINGITRDDLDVIEQLDLLDFLSTRKLAVDEMEERG